MLLRFACRKEGRKKKEEEEEENGNILSIQE